MIKILWIGCPLCIFCHGNHLTWLLYAVNKLQFSMIKFMGASKTTKSMKLLGPKSLRLRIQYAWGVMRNLLRFNLTIGIRKFGHKKILYITDLILLHTYIFLNTDSSYHLHTITQSCVGLWTAHAYTVS